MIVFRKIHLMVGKETLIAKRAGTGTLSPGRKVGGTLRSFVMVIGSSLYLGAPYWQSVGKDTVFLCECLSIGPWGGLGRDARVELRFLVEGAAFAAAIPPASCWLQFSGPQLV